jgi:hypothetical protein
MTTSVGGGSARPPGQWCLKCQKPVENNARRNYEHFADANCLTYELVRDVLEAERYYEKFGVGSTVVRPSRIRVGVGNGRSDRTKQDHTRTATDIVRRWKGDNMPASVVYYVARNLPALRTFLESHHDMGEVSAHLQSIALPLMYLSLERKAGFLPFSRLS